MIREKSFDTGGSACNVKAESLRPCPCSCAEGVALWQQHTEAADPTFDAANWPAPWPDTAGQLGRKRTDLYLAWPLDEAQDALGPVQRAVIELKLWKKSALDPLLVEGLTPTVGQADGVGADAAYLVIFDRRPTRPDGPERPRPRAGPHGRWSMISLWGM